MHVDKFMAEPSALMDGVILQTNTFATLDCGFPVL